MKLDPDVVLKVAPCPEDQFTQAAFFPFIETTLTAAQFDKLQLPAGKAIWKRYCSLFKEWQDTLIQKLSKDWADGTLKSPLEDMSLLASFLVVMNYPPSTTAGETSYDCSTTKVIAEFFKLDFIYVDLVPVIPSQNKKKDQQMVKYAKIPEIAKNYRKRLLCILELQALIGIKPTLLIGGPAAASALSVIPHTVVIPQSGSTVWNLTASSVYAVLSNHLSSGMMSGQNVEQASLLRTSMLLACAIQKTVSAGDSIDNYHLHQTQIEQEREAEVVANSKLIEETFGAGSVANFKLRINSILHYNLKYLKQFYQLLYRHTQDKSVLLDLCSRSALCSHITNVNSCETKGQKSMKILSHYVIRGLIKI